MSLVKILYSYGTIMAWVSGGMRRRTNKENIRVTINVLIAEENLSINEIVPDMLPMEPKI